MYIFMEHQEVCTPNVCRSVVLSSLEKTVYYPYALELFLLHRFTLGVL